METENQPSLIPSEIIPEMIAIFPMTPALGAHVVELPKNGEIITVGMVESLPVLWVRFKTNAPPVKRKIFLIVDNQNFVVDGKLKYLGSVTKVTPVTVPPSILTVPGNGAPKQASQVEVVHMFDCGEDQK